MPEHESLYRVLQVDPAASPLVIQAAYRVLARIFHPDLEGDDAEMKRLNHAWSILGDARSRAEYDRERAGRHPSQGRETAPFTMHGTKPDDHAGPPTGEPFGPLLTFGRYAGWTLGQVSRVDRTYLEWLRNVPTGRGLKVEIDAVLSVRKGPGAVDESRHYETNRARVHTWAPGAPTRVR